MCEMGKSCTKAHSAEELQEWIQRVKIKDKRKKQALKEGLLSYQDRLLSEYQTCSNEVLIVSSGWQGGSITRSLLAKSLATTQLSNRGLHPPSIPSFEVATKEPAGAT